MGSWECDTGAPSALTIGLKTEKEKYFLFLFSTDFVIYGTGKQGIFP
jgi:hypothetical protein